MSKSPDPSEPNGANEQVNVPNETGTRAEVNSPYEMKLWDATGRSVVVSSEDEAYWLNKGFRRNKLDIREAYSKLSTMLDAAKIATANFVTGVLADGEIDPSDTAAMLSANIAMSEVAELYVQLVADISTLYPVRPTGTVVKMIAPSGVETVIAAEQVEMYTDEHGYKLAAG